MPQRTHLGQKAAHLLIRAYQLTLSALIGRTCRHLPSCSEYTDEAIFRHGVWAGGWMGVARICRCRPGGTRGLDFVCEAVPPAAVWYMPWRYGLWRSTNHMLTLEAELPPHGLSQPGVSSSSGHS
jgi:uncharacterized protein